jgi:hypothetical protein
MRAACLIVVAGLLHAESARYLELRRVVDRNTGFAHGTRGVNMYTLYALRGCVTDRDIPVLHDLLRDKDRITRMATASVLADLSSDGVKQVKSRLGEVKDVSEKLMLQDALDEVARATYRPILQYPMSPEERSRIKGCS